MHVPQGELSGRLMGQPEKENSVYSETSYMHTPFNPLKTNSSNCYTMPCRPNLPFSISDIWALWCSALSARVPECQKLKMVG